MFLILSLLCKKTLSLINEYDNEHKPWRRISSFYRSSTVPILFCDVGLSLAYQKNIVFSIRLFLKYLILCIS